MKEIAAKLVRVMGEIKFINNDARNNEQNYNYASDEAVLSEVKRAMVACNVCSMPKFKILSNTEGQSNSGKKYNKIEMECEITVVDADSGETIESNGFGAGIDYGGDKALMKAQTVCHKYALQKLFNMPTGNNPEADTEVDKEAKTPPTQNKPTPANPAPKNPCSESQQRRIETLWQELGRTEAALKKELQKTFRVDSVSSLSVPDAVMVIKSLNDLIEKKKAEDEQKAASTGS